MKVNNLKRSILVLLLLILKSLKVALKKEKSPLHQADKAASSVIIYSVFKPLLKPNRKETKENNGHFSKMSAVKSLKSKITA